MTKLSVNINKIATLRNARGGNNPDLIQFAKDCQEFGADGITVHPRPDERHIRYSDVRALKPIIHTELNIEGFPDENFLQLIAQVQPHQVTLVPDSPTVLTSNQGWDTITHRFWLQKIIYNIKQNTKARVSIFVNPDIQMVEGAAACGAHRIELYTGPYAEQFNSSTALINTYRDAADKALELGLGINAGHDLNLQNLSFFIQQISQIEEVSIGHALICDALYYGIHNTIQLYQRALKVNEK